MCQPLFWVLYMYSLIHSAPKMYDPGNIVTLFYRKEKSRHQEVYMNQSISGRARVWSQSPRSRKRVKKEKILDLGKRGPGKGRVSPTTLVWLWSLRAGGSLQGLWAPEFTEGMFVPMWELEPQRSWAEAGENPRSNDLALLWGKKELRDVPICPTLYFPNLKVHMIDLVKMHIQIYSVWVGPKILNF